MPGFAYIGIGRVAPATGGLCWPRQRTWAIATVTWGNKRLGIIKPKAPLIIERPRDSGPMDVVFKSQGYVTVHTRVYTFTNNTLAVKLTPLDKKNTLYGYREELPPEVTGVGGAGGAGAIPPAGTPPLPGAMPAPGAGTP